MGELSGHSFRVGGAVDMLSKGIPPCLEVGGSQR